MLQNIAELISLSVTFPTVVLAAAVIYTWFPSAREAFKDNDRASQDWFILGVVAGFIGSFLDNIYWFIPWSASFLEHESFSTLTNLGVFFNIFFRQGFGILAAYCHLKAAQLSSNNARSRGLNTILCVSYTMGLAYSLVLILLTL